MGDVINSVVNTVEKGVGDIGNLAGDVAKGAGQLLQNPMVDTAIGSLVGMPELGMLGPTIGGMLGAAGGGGAGGAQGLLGGLTGMLGGSPSIGSGLSGMLGGLTNNPLGSLSGLLGSGGLGGLFGGGTATGGASGGAAVAGGGTGSGTGPAAAGGFDPTAGLAQMQQQMQANFQLQQQMSAIEMAFQAVSKELSMAEDAAKTAMSNVH